MSDTNDIIDQIEVKVNEQIAYIKANAKYLNNPDFYIQIIKNEFHEFKAAEYDTREDWEIEEDAKESRMCDEFHARRDNKLTR